MRESINICHRVVLASSLFCLTYPCVAQFSDVKTPGNEYDIVSIHPSRANSNMSWRLGPDGFAAMGVTPTNLIEHAYNIFDYQLSGGPQWLGSSQFDVVGKLDKPDEYSTGSSDPTEKDVQVEIFRQRLRSILVDRFHLKVHAETKQLTVFALLLGKNGLKMERAAPSVKFTWSAGFGSIRASGITMEGLVKALEFQVGRRVVDKTGLKGKYNFELRWTPDTALQDDSAGPSIITALQEQLGLKLESQKGSVSSIVVDQIEMPTAN